MGQYLKIITAELIDNETIFFSSFAHSYRSYIAVKNLFTRPNSSASMLTTL